MPSKYNLVLCFVIFNNWLSGIDCRCGYPEMPYMSKSIESKDYFEEGEKLYVSCIGGVAVGQTMRDHVIQCRNNTWNTTSLRCSSIHNITAIDITPEDNSVGSQNHNLAEQEFLYLTDADPSTCVLLKDNERWTIHLGDRRLVSDVALVTTFLDSSQRKTQIDISITLPTGQVCKLEERSERENSAMVFMVYKCPDTPQPIDSVTIDLKTTAVNINVCALEVFTLIVDDCGKPEIPLYSYTNQMRIQNGTKIAEYVCAKGYEMVGPSLRTCGPDGLWKPPQPPRCEPEIRCLTGLVERVENFTFEYKDFDLFGNALPDVSTIVYHCLNRSLVAVPATELYCQPDGNWSQVDYIPDCHPRRMYAVFGHHFLNDKHLMYYGGAGLVVLFIGSFVILFQMRRLAKKISRQMREKSYFDQEKQLPHYNNETNYQDLTNLFAQHDATMSQPSGAIPQVQQTDQKY
ncbi:unnamed protein product [Oppiella nova]|uniref:Sushi domain-containing protein n=1 Tax=Oppiella nova TaxID=334625 RepID=A0A7R9QP31_9ACAR|nr:unnamed protein product [Oppiella nova]CAG2170365.1 unnamed protein product [Oppiella nova]